MVDNASRDGSVAYVRQTFPWVRLILLPENRGFSGGNIAGLQAITVDKEMVVLLNNDTAPELTWLEHLVAAAIAHPDCGAIASLMVTWNGTRIDSAGDGMMVTGRGYKRFHRHERVSAPPSGYVFSACGGAALYRQSMLNTVGFLDDRFFMNSEDTDLCFRARLSGWKVWYCAEAVVRHRVSASQGVWSKNSVYYNVRNHLWMVAKCMPAPLLVKYCWAHAFEFCKHGVYFTLRGRLLSWLLGFWAGLSGMRPFLEERKRLQHARAITLEDLEKQLSLKNVFMVNLKPHGDTGTARR